MKRAPCLLIAFLALAVLPRAAFAIEPHVLTEGTEEETLDKNMEVYEDSSAELGLAEVRAREQAGEFRAARKSAAYGFSRSAFWFHFALRGGAPSHRRWLLQLDYPLLDEIDLFVERADGTFEHRVSGDHRPFSEREIDHPTFVFSIELDPGQTKQVYLRVRTESSVQVPLRIWSPAAFARTDRLRLIWLGLYYGAMLIMVLYNLFVFFSVRDRSYLYYVIYVPNFLSFQAFLDGLTYQYLWPNHPVWNSISSPLFTSTALVFGGIFAISFLELKRFAPRWYRAMVTVCVTAAVTAASAFVLPYSICIRAGTAMAFLSMPVFLGSGIAAWRAGHRSARFFVIAWSAFIAATTAAALLKFGVLPATFITVNCQRVASLIEVTLLSFALADRINEIKKTANENLQREVDRQTKELREKNEALEENAERLRELDDMKTRFFSNVSHEFRTPLTMITGPLEAARRGDFGETSAKLREQHEIILRNARRLLRLINQLLDITRLEGGRMVAAFEPRNLGDFTTAVVDTFRPFAESKGLQVSCEVEGETRVYIDPDRMDKVLFNLLSNACKFTEQGEIRVRVRGRAGGEDEAGSEAPVEIEVRDTGMGIRAEELPHVFERFRQADGSATRAHEGSGLGLALTRELVELHGGSIEVASEVGHGTTFTVGLKRGRDHLDASMVLEEATGDAFLAQRAALELAELEEAEGPAPPTTEAEASAPAEPADGGILVVDDNADLRAYVARLLGDYRVRTATDGVEALRIIEAEAPRLVVSDVMMPRMDGNELCAAIKSAPATAHIPVILLTAQAGLEKKLEGLAARADDYITKPFQREELLARVHNLLVGLERSEALRALNRELEQRVLAQAEELQRRARLGRFLPPTLTEQLLKGEVSLLPERRFVGALRIEITAFDELAGQLGPESLAALVGQFQTLASEAVFDREGTIVSLHNCALEAIFGAPRPCSEADAARAAVDTANILLDGLARVADAWRDLADRVPLGVRGAVDCGDATVGAFGDGEWSIFTAVGGPALRAGSMCARAATGQVLVSERAAEKAAIDPQLHRTIELALGDSTVESICLPMPEAFLDTGPRARPTDLSLDSAKTLSESDGDGVEVLDAIQPGTVLGGRFRVIARLGRGGMGAVYEAADEALEQPVALKLFAGSTPEHQERILREVRIARLVTHENVCRVFDLHILSGMAGVTMELIRGASVRAHIRQGPVALDRILRWAIPVCQGLRAAHACGVVHRDIKPENILIEDSGRPVLVDFGIARVAADRHGKKLEGTLDYLSPEQVMHGRSDARSDVYAFGVVLFEMATAVRPFTGDTSMARAMARCSEDPFDPSDEIPDLDPALVAVIMRCLAREPINRFQRIADVSDHLERIAFRSGCAWRDTQPVPRPTAAQVAVDSSPERNGQPAG